MLSTLSETASYFARVVLGLTIGLALGSIVASALPIIV